MKQPTVDRLRLWIEVAFWLSILVGIGNAAALILGVWR